MRFCPDSLILGGFKGSLLLCQDVTEKKCIEVLWMCLQQWNINMFSCSQCSSYSLKCDLLWSTSWILLQARRWSSCTPPQEHGEWSTVPRVARKAILHSGSAPRMSPGSISLRHPSRLKSFSLHCSSSKLQHLLWKVFNISLVKKKIFLSMLPAENWRHRKTVCLFYPVLFNMQYIRNMNQYTLPPYIASLNCIPAYWKNL